MSPFCRTSSWIVARVCGAEEATIGILVHSGKNRLIQTTALGLTIKRMPSQMPPAIALPAAAMVVITPKVVRKLLNLGFFTGERLLTLTGVLPFPLTSFPEGFFPCWEFFTSGRRDREFWESFISISSLLFPNPDALIKLVHKVYQRVPRCSYFQ